MANFYREPDRRQRFLLPVDMSEWVSEADMVHLLLDAIELMDLSAFEAHYTRRGTGAPAFSPSMMVCVLIYAYANGHRSSRRIKRLCERDAGFRMIVGDEAPDHSVIARFRKRHRREFEALFAEVLKLCHQAGLVRLGVVALDGTKVKANASLAANRTARSLETEVAAMVSEAEDADAAEDALFGDERGDELPAGLRNRSGRKARLRACLDQIHAEAEADAARQREKLAGEDRRPRGRGGGHRQAQAGPMAAETADCEYLIATAKDWKQRKAMREAPPPRGRMPRTLTARERMDRKLLTKRGRTLYRLRGQTVEPVFGQMKEAQGADGFMMRGKEEAQGEWSLHCAGHNLRKLHSESIRRGRKGGKWLLT